jgi:hypothetical protein
MRFSGKLRGKACLLRNRLPMAHISNDIGCENRYM